MKKLIFMLGGAVIAGGAIFAIQSYATSTPTLPTDEEIVGLKSINNNNQLTAIMWDKMLDFLGKVNVFLSQISWDVKKNAENIQNLTSKWHKIYDYGGGDTISNANLFTTRGNHPPVHSGHHNIGPEKALSNAYRFFDDGTHGLSNNHLGILKNNSVFLWRDHKFCALSLVAMTPMVDRHADQICYVYRTVDGWYLYENDRGAAVYCQASCF